MVEVVFLPITYVVDTHEVVAWFIIWRELGVHPVIGMCGRG